MPMLLKKMFAADAFRTAHHGERAARQSRQRMIGDRTPVFRQGLLGDPGPQLTFGMGERTCPLSRHAVSARVPTR